MFQNIFRTVSLSANVMKIFLTRNHSLTNVLRRNAILTIYSPKTQKKLGVKGSLVEIYPEAFPPENRNYFVLFGGILTFLGIKKEEGEEEPELIKTIRKGILSIRLGDFEKAERILHSALQLAYEESNEDGITYVNDVLANLALDTGQYQKAEKLFLHVMQRLLGKGYDAADDKIIHISLKLAKIYELSKDDIKAEIGYKYCLNNLENKISVSIEDIENNVDTLKLWITTLDTYARFLVAQNRAKEAINYFHKALDMSIQVNGKEHEDTALLLSDLGMTSNDLGDLDSAVSYAEEAVQIAKNISDMEHLPIIYINLGYLYLSKEMFNEAKVACTEGMKFARRDEDKDGLEKGKQCLNTVKEILKNKSK